jgi:hypothetical protein
MNRQDAEKRNNAASVVLGVLGGLCERAVLSPAQILPPGCAFSIDVVGNADDVDAASDT